MPSTSVSPNAGAAPRLVSVSNPSGNRRGEAGADDRIEGGQVGGFIVGQKLDATLFAMQPGGAQLRRRYRTRLYADAQPLEGFVSDRPPLFVVVQGGPFQRFGYDNPQTPVPDRLVDRAVAMARSGALGIQMLVVTSSKVRTAKGVGVGSRFDTLMAAYPKAELSMLPGLWEEPSCIVDAPLAPAVSFFFKGCRSSNGGVSIDVAERVIRVVLRRPKQG